MFLLKTLVLHIYVTPWGSLGYCALLEGHILPALPRASLARWRSATSGGKPSMQPSDCPSCATFLGARGFFFFNSYREPGMTRTNGKLGECNARVCCDGMKRKPNGFKTALHCANRPEQDPWQHEAWLRDCKEDTLCKYGAQCNYWGLSEKSGISKTLGSKNQTFRTGKSGLD
jgi:hypothetical protein